MKFDIGDTIFRDVAPRFESRFPSADSLASDKFRSMLEETRGAAPDLGQFAQWSAKAYVDALQITQKYRAVYTGDLLKVQVDKIFRLKKTGTGDVVEGLFGEVAFPASFSAKQLLDALATAGFTWATRAIAATGVYGMLVAGALTAGRQLGRAFDDWDDKKNPPNYLPWSEYSKDLDEDIVDKFHLTEAKGVDWTTLYMPPFDLAPWEFGWRNDDRDALVFGPRAGQNKLDWNGHYGCIPGTARVLGNSQAMLAMPEHPEQLVRRAIVEQGWKVRAIPWSLEVTQTGDYQPALGQLGLALWEQIMVPGPEMYRIHAQALLDAWQQLAANLYETGFASLRDVTKQLKAGGGGTSQPYIEVLASQLLEPFIVVRQRPTPWALVPGPEGPLPKGKERWVLGAGFPASPRPSAIVHPRIFVDGPVPKEQRAVAAWWEWSSAKRSWGWPYAPWEPGMAPAAASALPKQNEYYAAIWRGFGSPDGGRLEELTNEPKDFHTGKPTKKYRSIPWPFPETAGSEFSEIYDKLVGPTVYRLKGLQSVAMRRVLDDDVKAGAIDDRVLLSAYVRPDEVGELAAYGAFRDAKLAKLACDARARLVELIKAKHPAREFISLQDVKAIDPAFEEQLRQAGATGARAGQKMPGPQPTVEGEPPQGGVPFAGGLEKNETTSRGGAGRIAAGLAAAVLAAKFLR